MSKGGRTKGDSRPDPKRLFTDYERNREEWGVTRSQLEAGIESILAFERRRPEHRDVKTLQVLRRRLQLHRDSTTEPYINFQMASRFINYLQDVVSRNGIDDSVFHNLEKVPEHHAELQSKYSDVAVDKSVVNCDNPPSKTLQEMEEGF